MKDTIHSRASKYLSEEIFWEDVSRLSQASFPQSYLTHFRDVHVIDVADVCLWCSFTVCLLLMSRISEDCMSFSTCCHITAVCAIILPNEFITDW